MVPEELPIQKTKTSFSLGLTGGIGAGKSQVADLFIRKGIPVYDSDSAAKNLMNCNATLKKGVIEAFGKESYTDGVLNRAYLASQVFSDKQKITQLNSLVHPAVFKDHHKWVLNQDSLFTVKESAILFESGAYQFCDLTMSVLAEQEVRISRVVERDEVQRKNVLDRISNQWTDVKRKGLSNFYIYNNGTFQELEMAFDRLFDQIMLRIQNLTS